ncbi:hypothetical protein HHI36_015857 [Cryptolaemus montrouzieri]|uniref:N-acylneuraminate cytidylyltransferase n=1 Tax=Cryptolaemus montrouzieri TaxID=559131 RepID=A0ABD2N773_9CUCU
MMRRKFVTNATVIIILYLALFANACVNNQFHILQTYEVKHIGALILARGGSKGIPLKNISKFGNKTLIANSIEIITKVKGFASIWVSTDSSQIFEEVAAYPVNVHWRAEEFASDKASSISAVQEFLKYHPEIDALALVQCTSPFLKNTYLHKGLEYLKSGNDCVFSVSRSYKLRWGLQNEALIPLNFNPKYRPRRQDWNGEFIENGMFYIALRSLLKRGIFQNNK